MKQVARGIHSWSQHSERLGYNLNGFYWSAGDAAVAVDPPPLTEAARDRMQKSRPPGLIVVTNHTHWRATDELRDWAGSAVAMSPIDAEAVDAEVERYLFAGDELPGGWRVIEMPGKTPGEIALHRKAGKGVVLVGDSLIGDPPGELRILPTEKIHDRGELIVSLTQLDPLKFEVLLVGDGEPILHDAARRVRDFLLELT